jgi:hypothetical protein
MSDVIYSPGQGYKDGWNDRHAGKANAAPMGWGSATTDKSVYWEEYRIGYAEASRRILDDAKRSIEEMKRDISQYLTEDSNIPRRD